MFARMSQTLSGDRKARRRTGGPRRWTAADKAAYLAAFATSPLTIKAFCAETGVPRATFNLWQHEARETGATGRTVPAFARVEQAPPASRGGLMMVVRGAGSLEAELTAVDATTVILVLRALLVPPR